jgi:hypothetical protein
MLVFLLCLIAIQDIHFRTVKAESHHVSNIKLHRRQLRPVLVRTVITPRKGIYRHFHYLNLHKRNTYHRINFLARKGSGLQTDMLVEPTPMNFEMRLIRLRGALTTAMTKVVLVEGADEDILPQPVSNESAPSLENPSATESLRSPMKESE